MNINYLIPTEKKDEIYEKYTKLNDLIRESNLGFDLYQFFSTPGVARLLEYHVCLETNVLELDETDSLGTIVAKLIELFLEEKYSSQKIAHTQFDLIWRALNPEIYGLDKTDIEKAHKSLVKRFNAKMAQAARIRSMMYELSIAVEPIELATSLLNGKVKLREKPFTIIDHYKEEIDDFDDDGLFEIESDNDLFGKKQYSSAKKTFDFLKKDFLSLDDLAIETPRLREISFRSKSKKYFKDRMRELNDWERFNVPIEDLLNDKNPLPTKKGMPFGILPVKKKLFNRKSDEYIILYDFSEDWKSRKQGSGGPKKPTQK